MDDIAIIICTEKGVLENMSKILVSSIRKFGGAFSNCPIYSFQPRKGQKVSQRTKRFFEENQVEFIDLVLNKKFTYYSIANKPLVCAWAEGNLKADILVFLDSDVIILKEPWEIFDVKKNEVRANPVALKGIGSDGHHDSNWHYWKKLYALIGVKSKLFTQTTIDNKRILNYWNTGHISVRKNTGLFNKWNDNLQKTLSQKLIPNNGLFFTDQTTFAATVSALELDVRPFGKNYNYHLVSKKNCLNQIRNDIVSLHYHNYFESGKVPSHLRQQLSKVDYGDWLIKMLKENDLKIPCLKKQTESFNRYKNNFIFKLK